MSYLENLLSQTAPLRADEIRDLEGWLAVLKDDCEMFGPCGEDIVRMRRIQAAIHRARNQRNSEAKCDE